MKKTTCGLMALLVAVILLAVGCPEDFRNQGAGENAALKQEPGSCTFMIRKFNDLNGNGSLDVTLDQGFPVEPEIVDQWTVYWQNPNGDVFSATAPVWCLQADMPGVWTFWEEDVSGWTPTGAIIDDGETWEMAPGFPELTNVVEIEITDPDTERFQIMFLNTQLENGGIDPPDCNLSIRKVNDLQGTGNVDPGDPDIIGWPILVTDPNLVQTTVNTPACIEAGLGEWIVEEIGNDNWELTNIYVNGVPVLDLTVPVTVLFECDEVYEIVFLNTEICPPPPGLGSICATKVYDADGDGFDETDMPIEGWLMRLTGTDNDGNEIGPLYEFTGADGIACWNDLPAGSYTVCEILPSGNWTPTTDVCMPVQLSEGQNATVYFANFCAEMIDMRTKGWWQSKHGCLALFMNPELLDALNALAPFQSGTIRTTGRDQCTGTMCQTVVLPFSSASELGCFIVAPNRPGQYPYIGLAQQLAAFVLNVQYQTGSYDLYFPDLDMTAQEIIDAAVMAWLTGVDVGYWQMVLDQLNNAGTINIISPVPCEIDYSNYLNNQNN